MSEAKSRFIGRGGLPNFEGLTPQQSTAVGANLFAQADPDSLVDSQDDSRPDSPADSHVESHADFPADARVSPPAYAADAETADASLQLWVSQVSPSALPRPTDPHHQPEAAEAPREPHCELPLEAVDRPGSDS